MSSKMENAFLEVRHISKRFGGVQALHDVSMTIKRGEIHCLAGENGSGKSTLIKIIAGVYTPDAGEIIIEGRSIADRRPIDAVREGIQVIYQDLSLFPNLTVGENLAINTLLERGSCWAMPRQIRRIATDAVTQLGLQIDLRREVADLSIAQRQLVAIAKALLQDARLIVMDEPTTALTQKEIDSLFRIIKGLQGRGISILFVSHKLREVLEISRRITILRNGRKVAEGDVSSFDYGQLVSHMTGREQHQTDRRSSRDDRPAAPLLRVKTLCRRGAFDEVSFGLHAGEILGITGLLGSGRRELAASLFGLGAVDSGRIEIDGEAIRPGDIRKAVERGIAYLPEDRLTEGLFLEQSIERNISAAGLKSFARRAGWLNFGLLRDVVRRWMAALSIAAPSAACPAQILSGGNQQKVVLAKWLATKAKVLILNGPTVGVDVGAKAEIHGKLADLACQGMGIIVISDDLPELEGLCDRVLVMHRGRIVDEFVPAEVARGMLAVRLSALE
jgi:simple sugar transport system ATP-binding protein